MTFEEFNLHPRVYAGVKEAGYVNPTPIQQQAIPAVLAGRDVLGLAQTGTGKTAAFALPMLHRLVDGPRGFIRALIVAPTRELAEQINDEIRTLGKATGLRSATVYGGVGKMPQVKALRGKTEIIVACPGRLLDHLRQGDGDLSKLEVLVLDEADHMFDMGFLPDVRRIIARVPKGAQRLLFSATMPAELRGLASAVLTDPVTVEIGHAAPAETVDHALYPVAPDQKLRLLEKVLGADGIRSALIFTRTKRGAEKLAKRISGGHLRVTTLQGNLSQNRRQKALDGFREGRFNVLVATDIAARGIDVTRVSHVINFDIPSTAEAYTHRIGRTGRAESSGEAITFITHEDEKAVRAIERVLGKPIERVQLDDFGGHPAPNGAGRGRRNGQRPDASSASSNGHGSRSNGNGSRSNGSGISSHGNGSRSNGNGSRSNGNRSRRRRGGRRSGGSYASSNGGSSSSGGQS